MSDSTTRSRGRSRAFRLSATALLVLAVGCSTGTSTPGDPSINAKDERGSGGRLEGLTVEGKGFTSNGTVLVTLLMSAAGGNASPYIEEEVQADGNGEIRYERQPVPCPQPADYERGSWVSVIARDMTSGISGSDSLEPGQEPDCRP
jgi:hypothetical protein